MSLFAVIRTRGPAWRADRTPQQQSGFAPHADVMQRLYAEGLVVLGGWLDDTGDVLLIVRASSVAEVRRRLDEDPWTSLDILPISRIEPWTLGLGQL